MVVDLVNVLVMTPVRSFGELLQQALQETDLYRVTLVQGKQQLLASLHNDPFPVVVLDLDLEPDPAFWLRAVDETAPDARLIVLRNRANSGSEFSDDCRVTKLLGNAFYLPDLFQALDEITADVRTGMAVQSTSSPEIALNTRPNGSGKYAEHAIPTWLRGGKETVFDLSKFLVGDQVQAAVVLSKNRLLAYGGHLPEPAGEELARFSSYDWIPQSSTDLARYIHLDVTGEEHLLYTTALEGETILGLAFKEDIPFSTIRAHVKELVSHLPVAPEELPGPVPEPDLVQEINPSIQDRQDEKESGPVHPAPVAVEYQAAPLSGVQGDLSENPVDPFSEEVGSDFETDTQPIRLPDQQEAAAPSLAKLDVPPDFFNPKVPDFLKNTLPMAVPDYLQDTIPNPTSPDPARDTLRQVVAPDQSSVLSDLHPFTYAFVLAPRHPQHLLVGELAVFINQVFAQFEDIFGWKLVRLTIRPEYLHWVAAIPATASPGMIAWQVRDQSDQQILRQFPKIAQQISAGDFWTREYLVVNRRDPLPQKRITDFIARARHHG